jgi:hypothetical protein
VILPELPAVFSEEWVWFDAWRYVPLFVSYSVGVGLKGPNRISRMLIRFATHRSQRVILKDLVVIIGPSA